MGNVKNLKLDTSLSKNMLDLIFLLYHCLLAPLLSQCPTFLMLCCLIFHFLQVSFCALVQWFNFPIILLSHCPIVLFSYCPLVQLKYFQFVLLSSNPLVLLSSGHMVLSSHCHLASQSSKQFVILPREITTIR